MPSPGDIMQGVINTVGLPTVFGFPSGKLLQQDFILSGVTRDAQGVALGNCAVDLFRTSDDQIMGHTTSDANGVFSFTVNSAYTYYLVAYLPGSPDLAGTTVNTLVGV